MSLFRPWLAHESFSQKPPMDGHVELTQEENLVASDKLLHKADEPDSKLSPDPNQKNLLPRQTTDPSRADTSSRVESSKVAEGTESNNFYSHYYNYYYSQLVYYASIQNYYCSLLTKSNSRSSSRSSTPSSHHPPKTPSCSVVPDNANCERHPRSQSTSNGSHVTNVRACKTSNFSKVPNVSAVAGCQNKQDTGQSLSSSASNKANDSINTKSESQTDNSSSNNNNCLRKISSIVNLQDILAFQNLFLESINSKKRTTKNSDQRPKKFICNECKSGFSNRSQLNSHIRTHTGERPFVCDFKSCLKSFTRNEELTRHRRIHSGIRPYPCRWCDKRFGRKDHLRKHERTHERRLRSTFMLNYSSNVSNSNLLTSQLITNSTEMFSKVESNVIVDGRLKDQSTRPSVLGLTSASSETTQNRLREKCSPRSASNICDQFLSF